MQTTNNAILEGRHHPASFASKCTKMRTENNTIFKSSVVALLALDFHHFFLSQWTSG